MSKIPIWTTNRHNISIEYRHSTHSLNRISSSPQSIKPIIKAIYIDQHILILSIGINSKNDEGSSEEEDDWVLSILVMHGQDNSQILIDRPVFECIFDEQNAYYLLVENLCGRYQVLKFDTQTKMITELQIKTLKPLRKYHPVLQYNKAANNISIFSNKLIHPYEKTSPFWKLDLTTLQWLQITLSEPALSLSKIGWVFGISDLFYVLKEDRLQIWNGKQLKEVHLQGLILDIQRDYKSVAWDGESECFYITIVSHNCENENVILKLEKNSVNRIDLGVVLGIQKEEIPKKPQIPISSTLKITKSQQSLNCFLNPSTTSIFMHNSLNFHTITNISHSANTQIEYTSHTIQINKLQVLQTLNTPNIKLSEYFINKKYRSYADLILISEKKQVLCSRELFEYYSPKFKKLYSSTSTSKSLGTGPINVRLDHAKLHTVYFLVQQLYHSFAMPLSDLDQSIILDLMILSQKFQIRQLQSLCQTHLDISIQNYPKLYDYIRNSETPEFRQSMIRFFVIHSQQLIKTMPIGKIEELIRSMYSPECQHTNWTKFQLKIDSKYIVTSSQKGSRWQNPKFINHPPLIKNQQAQIHICDKCRKVLDYSDQHRKNKSINRSNISCQNHKKDNNSN